ncbi:MAG TPA: hypothetical protein VLB76_09330 [Thermoanaerobaculia bacterium]|jgi:hypothetical protein|nr:hypothetical protein [Thermoanaerobaculia bacterium]
MKLAPSTLLFCVAVFVVGSMEATTTLKTSYDRAIKDAAKTTSNQADARRLRQFLEESMSTWNSRSDFVDVRRKISTLKGIKRQFRLEIGNINSGGYHVVWFVETDRGIAVFSNMSSRRQVLRGSLQQSEWIELLNKISELKKDVRCKSDLGVSDGSSYFGILASNSSVKSFAVYGAIPFPRTSTAEDLYFRLSPCSEIVLKAYALAQTAIP